MHKLLDVCDVDLCFGYLMIGIAVLAVVGCLVAVGIQTLFNRFDVCFGMCGGVGLLMFVVGCLVVAGSIQDTKQ